MDNKAFTETQITYCKNQIDHLQDIIDNTYKQDKLISKEVWTIIAEIRVAIRIYEEWLEWLKDKQHLENKHYEETNN